MTQEQLDALKEGQRVRLSVEGEVIYSIPDRVQINVDGTNVSANFYRSTLLSPTCQVEILEEPVDPMVRLCREIMAAPYKTGPEVFKDYLTGKFDDSRHFQDVLAILREYLGGRV